MPIRSDRTPSYRLHKPTGQAVVTLSGRDFYLGRHGTPESRAEYDRIIAEWLSLGRRLPGPNDDGQADLTVNEMLVAYLRHADAYYTKHGQPTKEPANIRIAVRALRQLYGNTLARDFGPRSLKALRQSFVGSGLCRNGVNKRTDQIKRAFKWAVSEELIPSSVAEALRTVEGLRRGRADVRESEPVRPVPDAFVDAVHPFVSRQVWAMIELQRLTGMRPGEVVSMRTIDIDTTGRIWIYSPESHKTEHHGRRRVIHLGPQAQATLRPWLRTELEAPLFSPAEADVERRAAMRAARKTPVQPSQRNRTKSRPEKRPGDTYTVVSYRRAITYGIARANRDLARRAGREIPAWHPNQLRHNAATRLRKEFGLDAARAVLGHSSPVVTEVYAELDSKKAAEVMGLIG
ncbi:tyrosine-type recombinase/integrase [Tautonia plasticadhaerens]|uniref:Site-specific tyrosine recombinase XerC n=1 Tax=Tautonia plasticadhaerens TaxID=2527974 RepID=A0A518GZV1_9BACT|nr:tyrosine-type recombinase/integrase [Tautonia plasticadhaerens]QDV34109.1 site-specific tyrosine recombinase XerC [Tautonia plasticadhaerens]